MSMGKGFLKGAGIGLGAYIGAKLTESGIAGSQFATDNPTIAKWSGVGGALVGGGAVGAFLLRGGKKPEAK